MREALFIGLAVVGLLFGWLMIMLNPEAWWTTPLVIALVAWPLLASPLSDPVADWLGRHFRRPRHRY